MFMLLFALCFNAFAKLPSKMDLIEDVYKAKLESEKLSQRLADYEKAYRKAKNEDPLIISVDVSFVNWNNNTVYDRVKGSLNLSSTSGNKHTPCSGLYWPLSLDSSDSVTKEMKFLSIKSCLAKILDKPEEEISKETVANILSHCFIISSEDEINLDSGRKVVLHNIVLMFKTDTDKAKETI